MLEGSTLLRPVPSSRPETSDVSHDQRVSGISEARARVLVAIDSDSLALDLVRFGAQVAEGQGAALALVHVTRSGAPPRSHEELCALTAAKTLAASLGAPFEVIEGQTICGALSDYGRSTRCSTIVVGQVRRPGLHALFARGVASRMRRSRAFRQVLVLPSGAAVEPTGTRSLAGRASSLADVKRYVIALGISALCTIALFPLSSYIDSVNVAMLYLLGTTVAALRLGRGPSALCVVANVAAFDFFFVPPLYSFDIADMQYVITLVVMLGVALTIAHLVVSIRHQTEEAAARERHTAALYSLSRDLAAAADTAAIVASSVRHLAAVFGGAAYVLLIDDNASLTIVGSAGDAKSSVDAAFAAGLRRPPALVGPRPIRHQNFMFVALESGGPARHVLAIEWPASLSAASARERLLTALANQVALALERGRLANAAAELRAAAERAALRNTLLASISHDLRGPLAAIAGAGSIVAQVAGTLDRHRRRTLGHLIEQKAQEMSGLLTNVLDLLRLESAPAPINADWQCVDDIVSTALKSHEQQLRGWNIAVDIPSDFPLLLVDSRLMVQLLSNLFVNAARHTPPGTGLHISAEAGSDAIRIRFDDDGPGFGARDPDALFEKFERGATESSIAGVGLGLAICRCIATLHGGTIRALNRVPHGARFEVQLPLSRSQPLHELEQ